MFLADDNLIVREGVKALIERNADLRVVGVAADYDGVVSGCAATEPQVLVTDVRMPLGILAGRWAWAFAPRSSCGRSSLP